MLSTSSLFSRFSLKSVSLSNSVSKKADHTVLTVGDLKQDSESCVSSVDVVKQHTKLCMATIEGVGANEFQDNAIPGIDHGSVPHVILDLCLEYNREKSDENISYPRILFFDKHLSLLVSQAANHILWGRLDEAEALVTQYPSILNYSIEAKDPCGRRVAGTLLQLAAMAGDFNLKKNAEEKDDGMVERLASAGGLSKEEVQSQITAVLFSEEAKRENEKRNQPVLTALKEFAEDIFRVKVQAPKCKDFATLRALCKDSIAKFKEALKPNPNEVITSGYIFDTKILCDAIQWFKTKKNLDRLGGWSSTQSNVFWINGFGLVQSVVMTRDAHAIRVGVGRYADADAPVVPERTLKNSDGSSYFFNPLSRLGFDFYLGYYGAAAAAWHLAVELVLAGCGNLMSSKNTSIAKVMQPSYRHLSQ